MRLQLHWQSRENPSETILVAQWFVPDEYDEKNHTEADFEWHAMVQEVIIRRKEEIPDGWNPMVCTQDYPGFVPDQKDGEFSTSVLPSRSPVTSWKPILLNFEK